MNVTGLNSLQPTNYVVQCLDIISNQPSLATTKTQKIALNPALKRIIQEKTPETTASPLEKVSDFFSETASQLGNTIKSLVKTTIQSKSAFELEKTTLFLEYLTKLRLANFISPADQNDLFSLYQSNPSQDQDLQKKLTHIATNIASMFEGKDANGTELSESIEKKLLADLTPDTFIQEVYAHFLLFQLPTMVEPLHLTRNEYTELSQLKESFNSNLPIRAHLPILETVTHRALALKWIDSIHTIFSCTTCDINVLKADLKRAICENNLENFKTLFLKHLPSNEPTTAEAVLRREIAAKINPERVDQTYFLLANQYSYQKQLLTISQKLQTISKIVQGSHNPITGAQFQKQIEELQQTLKGMVNAEVIASIAPSVLGILQDRCRAEVETIVKKITLAPANTTTAKTANIARNEPYHYTSHTTLQPNQPTHRVSVWYHKAGQGHASCAKNMQAILEQDGYLVTTTDAGREVIKSADIVHQVLGKLWTDDNGQDFSFDSLFNYFCKKDLIIVLKLLQSVFGSRSPSNASLESFEAKRNLIRQRLLAENPDLLILAYSHDLSDTVAVADELGIPVIYTTTDFDYARGDVRGYPHFTQAVPTLHSEAAKGTLGLGESIAENQVVEIGLPVHLDYEKTYSAEELDQLRKELGILPEEKVIMISSGGAGVANVLPEYLAKNYANKANPWRLVVITGNNKEYKEHLETNVLPNLDPQGALRMTVLGFRTDKAKISQLAHITCGKGGGLDTFENRKLALPKVFDEIQPSLFKGHRFSWEKLNASVVIDDKLGTRLTDLNHAIEKFEEALKLSQPTNSDQLSQKKASENMRELVSKKISAAGQDALFQQKKQFWKELQPALQ